MSLQDDIKIIGKIFQKHQTNFRFQAVAELINSDEMQVRWLKSPLKDRYKEDKNIMTLNLILQGFTHRRIGHFCGISHQAVVGRLRKAVSMIKARYPGLDIWEKPIGEEFMNVTLAVEGTFAASHVLVGYRGPCGNLHGHTWRVLVRISGCPDPLDGILVDFHYIKKMMKDILPDHRHLNDIKGLKVPTAENISVWLYNQFALDIIEYSREIGRDLQLVSVTVWESPEASATYTGE